MVVDEDDEVSEIEMLLLLEVRGKGKRVNDPCMHTWLRERDGISSAEEGVWPFCFLCFPCLLALMKATLQSFLEQWGWCLW